MRYSVGRAYSLVLHDDALADLDRIYEKDEEAAADIEVFWKKQNLTKKPSIVLQAKATFTTVNHHSM